MDNRWDFAGCLTVGDEAVFHVSETCITTISVWDSENYHAAMKYAQDLQYLMTSETHLGDILT